MSKKNDPPNAQSAVPVQMKLDVSQDKETELLIKLLDYLKLTSIAEHYEMMATKASKENSTHVQYLTQLVELEVNLRQERSTVRRVKMARFPVIKTLEQFNWNWPKKINRLQVKDWFRLQFMKSHTNVILLGGVGLGKTHLATALGYHACLNGKRVLFTNTIDVINTLLIAKKSGRLKIEIRKYLKPELLILDELGYLPIDKDGADCLFQTISGRYETGSTVLTSNKAFKDWAALFNHDFSLTSALLDRLLHHAETVVIEGPSYRMKDQIET